MTTKLEQDFEKWWEREGQEFLYALNTTTDDDIKLVAEVAWKNGAYCAEQAEQKPVAIGSEWKPCMKLPVVVHVREQREGESHVSTREGITPVRPDDLIMRGVAGEEYPIGRELFNKTYTFDTAAPVSIEAAVLAEREACAKVADKELMNTNMLTSYPPKSSAAWNIAAAIRARK